MQYAGHRYIKSVKFAFINFKSEIAYSGLVMRNLEFYEAENISYLSVLSQNDNVFFYY